MADGAPDAASPALSLNLEGDKVALGPLRRDLLPVYARWANDFAVQATVGLLRPTTEEGVAAWYERASAGGQQALFTVYERATRRPIGLAGLEHIEHFLCTAELTIRLGERDCWGRGYGTEATRLALDYGFTGLGLHNIWLGVFAFNARALRVYERAGFRVVGRRREAYRLGGRAYDIVYMDCLATEFQSPVMHRLLPCD